MLHTSKKQSVEHIVEKPRTINNYEEISTFLIEAPNEINFTVNKAFCKTILKKCYYVLFIVVV